jgi:hypothetical protein
MIQRRRWCVLTDPLSESNGQQQSQCPKSGYLNHRNGYGPDWRASGAIKHPARQFQPPIHSIAVTIAAENFAAWLLDYLVEASKATEPRMQLI